MAKIDIFHIIGNIMFSFHLLGINGYKTKSDEMMQINGKMAFSKLAYCNLMIVVNEFMPIKFEIIRNIPLSTINASLFGILFLHISAKSIDSNCFARLSLFFYPSSLHHHDAIFQAF